MQFQRLIDILVVVGPSGCGKSTLIRRLRRDFPREAGFSVSHTTRSPRAGEKDGVDYHFVSKSHFKGLINNHAMVEYTWLGEKTEKTGGDFYGTSVRALEQGFARNQVVLMDTDLAGVVGIRRYCAATTILRDSPPLTRPFPSKPNDSSYLNAPLTGKASGIEEEGGKSEGVRATSRAAKCKVIFIDPPDMATLRARLGGRQSESAESLALRLKLGSEWIQWADRNPEWIDYRLTNDNLERCYAAMKRIFVEDCLRSLCGTGLNK
ncbi:unnamed protein product [Phytomonas sp. Hart1]|nr:unnamed protein product [Phytomonas sp. Hart1]|eukprot:CCW66941.1 unnamed protein product [Phytomonas sp. isolate Hart1]